MICSWLLADRPPLFHIYNIIKSIVKLDSFVLNQLNQPIFIDIWALLRFAFESQRPTPEQKRWCFVMFFFFLLWGARHLHLCVCMSLVLWVPVYINSGYYWTSASAMSESHKHTKNARARAKIDATHWINNKKKKEKIFNAIVAHNGQTAVRGGWRQRVLYMHFVCTYDSLLLLWLLYAHWLLLFWFHSVCI